MVDSSGNIYTTGYFGGTVDFDPGVGTANLTSASWEDIFVSKLDTDGNYVWAKSIGGTGEDSGSSVAVDSLGNVYTSGRFATTADSTGGGFVLKLDTNGNDVWDQRFGGMSATSVTVDSSDNVYTTGSFAGTYQNLTSAGLADVFVSKLDTDGNYVWAKRFGGTGDDRGRSVAVDSSGNVYTTGSFESTVDFHPDANTIASKTSAGRADVFVSKLDTDGNYVWAKRFGGTGSDTGSSVAVDSSGNVYTTGSFQNNVRFDLLVGTSNRTSAGGGDAFVLKLDASGNYVWAGSIGGTGSDTGSSVTQDSSSSVYITGYFEGTVDFDLSDETANFTGTGGFRLKLDKSNGSSTTPITAPGAPTSVSASSAADTQSVVSWSAPVSTGGAAITGYTVTSSPGGRTCEWTSGALSCVVTGLTNGTGYTFSVTATNASGTSSTSGVSNSVTPTASQSITFATVGTQLLGGETVALSATATSSLAIAFSSVTPTVCTVSGSTVALLTTGECTINANQAGGSGWDAAPQVSKTFAILPSPPVGEPGASINNGDAYTGSKKVVLNLVWPEYATSVRISNDGGFAASKTQVKDLAMAIDWELDDSVLGINTKVVYLRFNGVADTSKTYIDDIVLDTTAPTIETSSAVAASSSVDVLLKVTDDLTGVNKVQIRNGTKTVTKDYATKLSVPLADLYLSVSSSGVRKSATTAVEIRVSDNAGNWTDWKTVTVAGLIETPAATTPVVATTVAPVVATTVAPVVASTIAPDNSLTIARVSVPMATSPKVTTSKPAAAKSIATFAKLKVLSTSRVSLKVVASSAKYCKVSGATLKGVKAGFCKVTVTVTPKKGRAASKTVTLKVTK